MLHGSSCHVCGRHCDYHGWSIRFRQHGELRLSDPVVDKFEGALDMQMSRSRVPWVLDDESKSLTLASSANARRRIAPAMKKIGIAVAKLSENLGIDFQVGGKLVRAKQAIRVKETKQKMGRFVKLGNKAGSRVFKTGGVPSIRHGAGVVGITVGTMRTINKMAARVKGRTTGRSNFARLAMDGSNQAHPVFLDPLAS